MNILAIESSCDETAAAVVRDGRTVLSNCIASQIEMHTIYGGVVPEIASRKHVEAVTGLADQAVDQAGLTKRDLDAVAVTYGPGLIGAVLVGVNFAKGAAMALDLPLIPVHHVRGHIAANYITHPDLKPPFVCLCVSGGTTLVVDVRSYTEMEVLGGTRDDAAGECFDKVARVLGIGYPGGGPMDRLADGGDDSRYELPRAHVSGHELDMSFSGLKTASLNLIHNAEQKGETLDLRDFAASFGRAVSESLVPRVMAAARAKGYGQVAVAGGVAVEAGADGVGLLLSEYLLLAGRVNGEEEQYGFYAACLAAAQGRPVTICTFDVAPDKTGTEFPREEEANPAMGLCGVRYCLAHPDFFETQLRALLRAGLAGNLRILLPMVSTRDEFEHALDAVYRAKCALRERGVPFAETVPVGAFIETPAAALTAGDLARRAAFFNVGTNNLIQYTYAADRVNPQVRAYLPAASPAVYRLVRFAVEAAAEARIPLCLCGEGAAQPALAEAYARLGVRAFSLPARELLEVKEYLMGVTL